MLQPERDQTVVQPEHQVVPEELTKTRRQLLGERATAAFTLLPEIETSYDWERQYLHSRIIGQEDAIEAIISALDRSAVRLAEDTRPIANFAFLGPTGVGKTETAKVLSEILAQSDASLVRIDCSNFSHGHEVASLTGSPPGYVGREQQPILSPERIEPYGTVVLFDEIEKGSPQLTNLLLQIMDNGMLELANGETVSFRDAVIVMTSNLGAKKVAREAGGARPGFAVNDDEPRDKAIIESAALKSFKDFFSPEFVNRLNEMVVFHSLDEQALHEVLEVKLNKMNSSYMDDFGAYISLSEMTRTHLVGQALEHKTYGVRPLIRALEKDIASRFGRYTAQDKIREGTEVYVYHKSELQDTAPYTYKNELIFATRPDASACKKIIKQPPDTLNSVYVVGETGTIKDDRPINYENE